MFNPLFISLHWQKIDSILPRSDCLDEIELDRLGRLSWRQRQRFAKTRTYLRQLLGDYLQLPPRSVAITYTKSGKPVLKDRLLHFNLSHSDEWMVVAINDRFPLGIDLEQIKPRPFLPLIDRYFCPEEKQWFKEQSEITELFYRAWVMKEAYTKLLEIPLMQGLQELNTIPLLEKKTIACLSQTIGEIEAPRNYKCALAYGTF